MQCKITIRGKVQGVFFRSFIRDICNKIGLNGKVKNCNNKSVEIKVNGNSKKINILTSKCYSGPPTARIDSVEINEENTGEFSNFKIEY